MPICSVNISYQDSWLNQTSALAGANVFTAPTSGLYRISYGAYVDCTGGSGTLDVNTYTTLAIPLSGSPNWNVSQDLRYLSSGQNVSFGTSISGSPTIDHYDAYLTIEQVS